MCFQHHEESSEALLVFITSHEIGLLLLLQKINNDFDWPGKYKIDKNCSLFNSEDWVNRLKIDSSLKNTIFISKIFIKYLIPEIFRAIILFLAAIFNFLCSFLLSFVAINEILITYPSYTLNHLYWNKINSRSDWVF